MKKICIVFWIEHHPSMGLILFEKNVTGSGWPGWVSLIIFYSGKRKLQLLKSTLAKKKNCFFGFCLDEFSMYVDYDVLCIFHIFYLQLGAKNSKNKSKKSKTRAFKIPCLVDRHQIFRELPAQTVGLTGTQLTGWKRNWIFGGIFFLPTVRTGLYGASGGVSKKCKRKSWRKDRTPSHWGRVMSHAPDAKRCWHTTSARVKIKRDGGEGEFSSVPHIYK